MIFKKKKLKLTYYLFRFLYPVGVSAVARAVDMVADGSAPRNPQSEKGATYDPMLNKPELQKVNTVNENNVF